MEKITLQQANEIINHLISELEKYGFAYVAQEVLESIEGETEQEIFNYSSPKSRLNYFFDETINILGKYSNDNYQSLIEKFGKHIDSKEKISSIKVELAGNEKSYVDLKDLPSYINLIEQLDNIKREINSLN